jgi:hypothetical protein
MEARMNNAAGDVFFALAQLAQWGRSGSSGY